MSKKGQAQKVNQVVELVELENNHLMLVFEDGTQLIVCKVTSLPISDVLKKCLKKKLKKHLKKVRK